MHWIWGYEVEAKNFLFEKPFPLVDMPHPDLIRQKVGVEKLRFAINDSQFVGFSSKGNNEHVFPNLFKSSKFAKPPYFAHSLFYHLPNDALFIKNFADKITSFLDFIFLW